MCDINGVHIEFTQHCGYWVWRYSFFFFHKAWTCARAAFLMILYYEDTIVPDDGYFRF